FAAVGGAGEPPGVGGDPGTEETDAAVAQADVHPGGVGAVGYGRIAHSLVRDGLDLELGAGADLPGGAPAGTAPVAVGARPVAVLEHGHPVVLPAAVAPEREPVAAVRELLGKDDGVAGAVRERGRDPRLAVHVEVDRLAGSPVPGVRVAEDLVVGPVVP